MAGRPLRDGFAPAPPPGSIRAVIEEAAEPAIGEEIVVFGPDGETAETLSSPGAVTRDERTAEPPGEEADGSREPTRGEVPDGAPADDDDRR